jgi:protein SCO1/2
MTAARIISILLAIASTSVSGVLRAELPAREVAATVGIDQKLDEQIPLDLAFRDDQGRDVRLGDYFGERPVILNMVYYECPMLCTQVLNGLVTALRIVEFDVGKEYDIVTVSIDHNETPELAAGKKRQYVEDYGREGAEKGWHFLVGDSLNVKRLADAVGFRFRYDPGSDEYAHASGLMIATPQGRLSRYFYGIEYAPRDIRFGLMDAADEKIGDIADKVLLLCYDYDPHTGQYGPAIMTLVQGAGVAPVLGIVGYIIISMRRERRRRTSSSAV